MVCYIIKHCVKATHIPAYTHITMHYTPSDYKLPVMTKVWECYPNQTRYCLDLLKIISCITFNCFSVPISYTVDRSGLAVST